MQQFIAAAHQNDKNALTLYRWHSEFTAAVQPVLGATEVILRNAMDRRLQAWNDEESGGTRSWLLNEPESPLRSLSAGKRREAKERADKALERRLPSHHRYGVPVTHDDVLAQVTFGLWKELLPNHQPGAGSSTENSNRDRLWREALSQAFPNEEDPSGELTFWRVAHVHLLRNRISHMESLLNIDVLDVVQDAFDLLRSIDRDVASWVSGASKVTAVFRQRPEV
ncbi:hypothetical protein OR221_3225 [Microbacterium laevaniformans OR221]|nr:hypothetical protein OR221_3225 [Microbacterium laevaniformans OR221]